MLLLRDLTVEALLVLLLLSVAIIFLIPLIEAVGDVIPG
jgi:hypothetical protein